MHVTQISAGSGIPEVLRMTGACFKEATTRELAVPFGDLQERFLFVQALETQKCYDEGVITSDADANIGSIFGIGFPAWTGGVRQFIANYPGGREAFLARAGMRREGAIP